MLGPSERLYKLNCVCILTLASRTSMYFAALSFRPFSKISNPQGPAHVIALSTISDGGCFTVFKVYFGFKQTSEGCPT